VHHLLLRGMMEGGGWVSQGGEVTSWLEGHHPTWGRSMAECQLMPGMSGGNIKLQCGNAKECCGSSTAVLP